MAAWLEWQAARRVEGYDLVFHGKGKPLGLTSKDGSGPVPPFKLTGLHFHDLRRSAVRNIERAGIPRTVAMSITGHRTERVYRRYDIVAEADLQAAGQKLAAYHEQQEPSLRRVK